MSLDAFLRDWRESRNVSPSTLRWYRDYLTPWIRLGAIDDPRLRLKRYLDRYGPGATRRGAWTAVRVYETWLARRSGEYPWVREVSTRNLNFAPSPEYPPLRPDEFERIDALLARRAAEAPSRRARFAAARNRLFFTLAFYTGARLGALRLLRPDDVDRAESTIQIRTKGGVEASIAVPPPAMTRLEEWLAGLPPDAPWIFPSSRWPDRPICAFQLSHVLPRLAREAGIRKRVWVHGLRHSAITHWLERDVPLDVAQRQALHRSPTTTLRYNHLRLQRVRQCLAAAYQ